MFLFSNQTKKLKFQSYVISRTCRRITACHSDIWINFVGQSNMQCKNWHTTLIWWDLHPSRRFGPFQCWGLVGSGFFGPQMDQTHHFSQWIPSQRLPAYHCSKPMASSREELAKKTLLGSCCLSWLGFCLLPKRISCQFCQIHHNLGDEGKELITSWT